MNLTQEIDSRIQRFVTELNELVRKQALQAVSDALGTNGAPARRGPGRPPGSGSLQVARAAQGGAGGKVLKSRARRKGEKRTAAELAQLESSLESHVQSNPGQGIEAIGKALGLPTGELSRPMKKLVQRGSVRTEGAKRATKYYASSGAVSGGTSASASGAATKRRGAGRKKAAGRKKSKKR